MSGLVVERLSAAYGAFGALHEATLSVGPGEHVAVLGPSGAGKSTLLRAVAGLIPAAGGRVSFDGTPWTDPAAGVHVPSERRGIGMMTQTPSLWPHLSAEKHLLLALKWRGVDRARRRAEAARLLDLVSLADRRDRRPGELSGGEGQRLALARALAGGSKLLLLDEPLASLDLLLRRSLVLEVDRAARAAGAAVLHVTHDPLDARAVATRIYVIEAGRIVQGGTLAELGAAPATPFVRAIVQAAGA